MYIRAWRFVRARRVPLRAPAVLFAALRSGLQRPVSAMVLFPTHLLYSIMKVDDFSLFIHKKANINTLFIVKFWKCCTGTFRFDGHRRLTSLVWFM